MSDICDRMGCSQALDFASSDRYASKGNPVDSAGGA